MIIMISMVLVVELLFMFIFHATMYSHETVAVVIDVYRLFANMVNAKADYENVPTIGNNSLFFWIEIVYI